jgi:hypothetical protein
MSYAPKPERVCKVFLGFQIPTLSLPTSILSKLLQPSNLLSFILPSTKDYSFFSYPRRLWEQVFSRFELKTMFGKEKAKMIRLCPFKEKERSEGKSPFGGQLKEKERDLMLGGQWKEKERDFMLGGQWKEKEKVPFHLFPLSPQATLLRPSSFSFDIKVLLYHGSRPLFMHFFPFPWLINYDRAF